MSHILRRETMWFTMQPDCYAGPNCDQIEPRWHCYAEGDKDSDYTKEPLSLDPRRYPPGTKIIVMEPTCPECGMIRGVSTKNDQLAFDAKCDECGFDWEAWTLDEYS